MTKKERPNVNRQLGVSSIRFNSRHLEKKRKRGKEKKKEKTEKKEKE